MNQLTREELEQLLVGYLYDELDAAATEAFEASVDAHPEVRDELAAHRRTRSLMARWAPEEPPPLYEVRAAARERVAEPAGLLERVARWLWHPATAAALGAFAVVAVSAWWMNETSHDEASPGPALGGAAPIEVATREPSPAPPSEAEVRAPQIAQATEVATVRNDGGDDGIAGVPVAVDEPEPKVAEASGKQGAGSSASHVAAGGVRSSANARRRPPAPRARVAKAEKARAKKGRPAPRTVTLRSAFDPDPAPPGPDAEDATKREKGRRVATHESDAQAPPPVTTSGLPAPEEVSKTARTAPRLDPGEDVSRPGDRGTRLLRAVEKDTREGRFEQALKRLAELAKLPGWEKRARAERRQVLEARDAAKRAAKPAKSGVSTATEK